MELPPATRIEDDRETLAHRSRTGSLPVRRAAAVAGLIVAVVAVGLYGQRLPNGSRATASPSGSPAGAYRAPASPVATVPVPTPLIVTMPATPGPSEDTGGLPQIEPPLYSLRASQFYGPIAPAVSGTRFYEVTGGGIDVTDPASDPSPNWYQVPVACNSAQAALAAAGSSLIYAYAAPQSGGSDCVGSDVWHLLLVDASSASARTVKIADLGAITAASGSTPLVAISSEVYAFAHQQTASSAIVEVHALSSEKLLWSTTVSGQVHSLSAGGSRILLSVVVAPSATQAYEAAPVNRTMWMDPTHRDPQPLGTAWGTPSLSLDGSAAAWFDASQPDCHSLDVDDLATGKSSTRVTLSSASPERLCAVTAEVFQGRTTVAWTPTDFRGSSFLAVWQSDGPSYAMLGLPTMSWIGLQGRTLAAVAERGSEAITVDLDLVESVLS